ncbi:MULTISPECIES: diguanylate cyclase domain-containing protein [unclassified Lebetimonas]|uniref:diguanylate cyclase domain-containing protein n=1 Tax=unclassified Lebetimonas TaxID=2648158 RepID=UPI000463F330|nr:MULTISPECIES: diguanylate cyclase [unclassified Lebetimonas]
MELRKKIALKLKHSKKEIIKLWLEDKEVKEFFDKNNLSLTKFKKGFALGFVNNFIDLIENDVRKCSYLHRLMEITKDKLTLKDIMFLCSKFKNAVLNVLAVKDLWFRELLDYPTKIILEYYEELYKRKTNFYEQLLDNQTFAIFEIVDFEITYSNKLFKKIFGNDLFAKIDQANCFEDLFKKDKKEWFKALIDNKILECIIKVNNKDFHLVLKIIDENIITGSLYPVIIEKVKENNFYDALTNLYTDTLFKNKVEEYISLNKKFFIVCVELENLLLLNYIYGRSKVDFAIKEFAKFLQELNFFAARVDGNKFYLIIEENNFEKIKNLAENILKNNKFFYENELISFKEKIVIIKKREKDNYLKIMQRIEDILAKADINEIEDDSEYIYFEEKREKILRKFFNSIAVKEKLTIRAYYNKLSISDKAVIYKIDYEKNNIEIKTSEKIIKIVEIGNFIDIEFENILIRGVVKDFDIENNTIFLTNFDVVFYKKKLISLELNPPLKSFLTWDNIKIPAIIKEISLINATVQTTFIYDYEKDMEINIEFDLNEKFDLKSKITFVKRIVDGFILYLEFEDKKKAEEKLSHFIAQKQLEIIKEIKEKI